MSQLENLPITITEASAGSGKTHNIAKEYLKILFSEFQKNKNIINKILAITFTNMATYEIRERIIKYLKFYALPNLKESKKAISTLNIQHNNTTQHINNTEIINEILNNIFEFNSNLNISTIDSFIVSLSKFLSDKLEIPGNFDVIMNIDDYVNTIVDEIVFEAIYNEKIKKIIYDFIDVYLSTESYIRWNPINDIKEKINIIWNKENICGKEIKKIAYDGNLKNIKEKIYKLKEYLNSNNIQINKRFKFMENLDNCIASINNDPEWFVNLKSVINRKFEKGDLLNNRSEVPDKEYIDLWNDIKKDIKNYVENLAITKENIYIEIYHLFLEKIDEKINYENYIPLEYIKRKLSKRLFSYQIYEHFLIDEFQDTSYVQWKILENLLKTGKSLFVVGDKKQAIYRWRGGVADLFEDVKKFSLNFQEKKLSENYRSGEYIVEFVNKIFSEENIKRYINKIFQKDNINFNPSKEILKIYGNASEKYSKDNEKKGYVYVCEIKNENGKIMEKINEKFINVIENLRKYYRDGDICVLVRENREIEKIIKVINEYNENNNRKIAIDAPFTANIKNNKYIAEIVYFLKFLKDYDDFSFFKFITGEIFYKSTKISKEEIFEWIMGLENKEKLYEKFKEKFNFKFNDIAENNFYTILVSIFEKFNVFENFKDYSLYFLHLLEIVKKREIKTLQNFFEFYEGKANEDDFYLNLSNSDAIHIMTIHKAKGLEFKAVIMPYAKIEMKSENIFIEEDNDFLNLYYLKKDYLNFSEKLKEIYYREYYKRYVDEINAIYVAMTRAKECLYIFIPEKIGRENNSLSDLIFGMENENNKERIIEIGNFQYEIKEDLEKFKEKIENIEIENFKYEDILDKEIEDQEKKEVGNLIHEILSKIEKYPDENLENKIKECLKKYIKKVKIEEERLLKLINEIFRDEKFLKFFEIKDNENVWREKEIVGIDEDNKWRNYRIDRIIERNNFIEVVDFKIGKRIMKIEEKYRKQIENYKNLLLEIYGKKIYGYLCYVDIEKNMVEVVEV